MDTNLGILFDNGCDFCPGDRVRGKAICMLPPGKQAKDICIIFKGKVDTAIVVSNGTSRTTHRHQVELFREVIPIQLGNAIDGTSEWPSNEWPFEFIFPLTCFHQCKSDNAPYVLSGDALLPPSFDSRSIRSSSDRATVEYSVKLKINSNSIFHKKEAKQVLFLRQPSNVAWEPLFRPLTSFFHWSSSSLREEQHSFKQKLQHIFASDPSLATPCIDFGLTLLAPTRIAINQASSLTCSIMWQRGPTDPIPTLVLHTLTIEIRSQTRFRIPRTSRWDLTSSVQATHPPFQHTTAVQLPLDGSSVVVWSPFILQASPQETLIPDFTTWTVAHRHFIRATMIVIHKESGHTFKHSTSYDPLEILPEWSMGAIEDVPPPQYQPRMGDDLPPLAAPQYQPAMGDDLPPVASGSTMPMAEK